MVGPQREGSLTCNNTDDKIFKNIEHFIAQVSDQGPGYLVLILWSQLDDVFIELN